MNYFDALILAFIEGLTEFLPISSTGHLILTSHFMGLSDSVGFVKSFNIVIQFGAIASVLVLYWRRFLPNLQFYKKIFVAFLPAAILGLLVKKHIDALLDNVVVVAIALILGGIVLIASDFYFKESDSNNKTVSDLKLKECLYIGLIQCFAFIPGVSRAASTILGGLAFKMSRKEAAEFSFFLAVPTLSGASLIKSLDILPSITGDQVGVLLFGTFFSFIFALAAIKGFILLVSRFGYRHFGIYRILLGLIVLYYS